MRWNGQLVLSEVYRSAPRSAVDNRTSTVVSTVLGTEGSALDSHGGASTGSSRGLSLAWVCGGRRCRPEMLGCGPWPTASLGWRSLSIVPPELNWPSNRKDGRVGRPTVFARAVTL
jgi:hypothetical protein